MRKIRKRVFAAVLAAALLFTMPGMVSYAEAEGAQTKDISESVTIEQAEDDAAEETGAETEAIQEPEAEDSDTNQPETPGTREDDARDTETDAQEPAEDETVPTQKEDAEECICGTLCTQDSINGDCPVCGAEDADLSRCEGEKIENSSEENKEDAGLEDAGEQDDSANLCAHHKEHTQDCGYSRASEDGEGSQRLGLCTYECRICPIEDLIAALPDEVTEDNAEKVRAQLNKILALYRELTAEEQEQIDLTRGYDLQAALDKANAPVTADGHAEQQADDEAKVDIGGNITYYSTLGEAFSAANGKNATITMLTNAECTSSDFNNPSPLVISGGIVTLDMNGKTLSGEGYGTGGIIGISGGSLAVQGNGTVEVRYSGMICTGGTLTVADTTFNLVGPGYGSAACAIQNGSQDTGKGGTVIINGGTITGVASDDYGQIFHYVGTTIINNVTTMDGTHGVFFQNDGKSRGKLIINGGTFNNTIEVDFSDEGIQSVEALLGDGYAYKHRGGTWATDDDLAGLTISNVTVEKIPLTIKPHAETSWYYNSGAHCLQMNAAPATEGKTITYEWYDGSTKLDCTADAYPVPETMAVGNYTYTCNAACDGYTLSHEFTFMVAACPHTGLTYKPQANNKHGGTCPDCGKVVSEEHTWVDGTCEVCNLKAVAQVETGGVTTYYGRFDDAWTAAKGGESIVTLLANVSVINSLSVSSGNNITFNGGTHSLAIESGFTMTGGELTITGGTVITQRNNGVSLAGGKLTVTGGTIEAKHSEGVGINVFDSGGIVRISGSAVIKGQKYGVECDSGTADIKISGGTITGSENAVILGLTWNRSVSELLENYGGTTGTHYAFYQNGIPVTSGLDSLTLPGGTYAVEECTKHIDQKYSHSEGSFTHTQTCAACGAVEEVNCCYNKLVTSNGQVPTIDCVCGATLTASLTGVDNLVYTGQAQRPTGVTFIVDGTTSRNITNISTSYTGNIDAGNGTAIVSDNTLEVYEGFFHLFFPIAKATPVVTWNGGSTQTLTYTGQAAAVTANVQLVNNETGTVSYSYAKQGSNSYTPGLPTDAGTYSVKASFAEQKNYTAAEAELTLTISPLAVTVTPDSGQHKEYGANDPELTYTINPSLIGNDKLTGALTYTGEAVGTYLITQGTLAAPSGNYTLTVVSGVMFEITKPSLEKATVAVDGSFIYNGKAQTPTADQVKVTLNGTVIPSDQYMISASSNINAGKATVTITATESGNYSGSASGEFTIGKATPDIGTVTAEEMNDTLDVSQVVLSRTNQTPAGTLTLAGSTLRYGTHTYTWKFTPDDTVNYVPITGTAQITVNDTIAPTAEYQIGTDGWKKFINTVSFGLFCKDYKTVTICGTDDTDMVKGSGIALTQYYISDQEMTDTGNIAWNTYTGPVSLNAQGTYFIYVKVTDNAGNTAVLNSEGIVIYAESTVSPAAFDYTYRQNQDCTVQLTMNGNTFKELTDNEGNAINTDHYTIDGNGTITLKAAYLDTLGKGGYTYKVSMNPQGIETDQVTLVYTFTVNVKAKELTVTGAAATGRAYNGTNTVEITAVTISGAVPGDDVAVDLSGVQGTLSSANAGTYFSVTLPELTLTGADKGNYTLVQPTGAVAASVTVTPLDAAITVGKDTYNKTFGDAAFTLDVTDNNTEADVQYEVTAGADVISVSNGTVTIQNAGTAAITVSLPASTNYNTAASKTITVSVAKKGGYTVAEMNRSYLYSRGNTDSIDLAALLPKDCGNVTYGTPAASGDVTYSVVPAVNDGKLSYTLNSGEINAEGTITVTVETRNYTDITVTVKVKLTDQIPVSLKTGTEVTLKNNILTYGEPLSKLVFNEAEFVGDDGKTVEGILAWRDASEIPDAGTASATWVFIPTDKAYASVEGTAAITVNKAVPAVSAAPTVAGRVYDPSITLKDDKLSGATVTGVGGNTLEGTWSWQSADIVPTVNNSGYVAVFTPTDTTNYEIVTRTITVTVTKAVPYIAGLPAAAGITYGDALKDSGLSGGTVVYGNGAGQAGSGAGSTETVAGAFTWKEPSTKPVAADSNVTEFAVVFTPSDTANYNPVEAAVKLTVNKAQNAPNMPGSAMSVSNSIEKVGSVPLPAGWEWQVKDTALEAGVAVSAVAVYTGADKGNYENETVTVAITRLICDHVAGDVLYTGEGEKAPTCTEDGLGHKECTKCGAMMESGIVVGALKHTGGTATCSQEKVCTRCNRPYGGTDSSRHGGTEVRGFVAATCTAGGYTGDTYCKDCGAKAGTGNVTPALGHDYTSRVTKEPTTEGEGTRTYTCIRCGDQYTKSMPRLPGDDTTKPGSGQPGDTEPGDNRTEETRPDTGIPFIKGEDGKIGWDVIRTEEEQAKEGSVINVDMNGTNVVPGDIFDRLKGRDITITFDMGGDIIWSVDGNSVTRDKTGDIDFDLKTGVNAIPVDIVNNVTGESYSIQLSLAHVGEFGFTAVLSINLGKENAGYTASLYYYNEGTGELEFICADEVAEDGTASLAFTHASDYVIAIDGDEGESGITESAQPESTEGTARSNTTAQESLRIGQAWSPWWLIVVGVLVIIMGICVFFLVRKRKEEKK